MPDTNELIVIECSEEVANALRTELEALPDAQFEITERKNLDGGEAVWIVLVEAVKLALPLIIAFFKKHNRQQPKMIKYGELEIVDPSREDIERWWRLVEGRTKPEDKVNV